MTWFDEETGRYLVTQEIEIGVPCSYFEYAEPEPLEKFIAELRRASEGLMNPRITGDCWIDHERDQASVDITVKGDRLATDEEIGAYQEQERRRQAEERARAQREAERQAAVTREGDEKALARARKAYPELFKTS